MNRLRLRFAGTLLALLLPRAADASPPYTIKSAVDTALVQSPTVQAAREKLNEVEANVAAAYSQFFPNIVASASSSYKKDPVTNPYALFGGTPYDQYLLNVQAQQPIYTGGAITGSIGLAKSARRLAQLDRDVTERDLTLNVIQSFYNVILAQKNVLTLEQTQKVEEDLLTTTEKFARLGRAQLLDVLQVKTQIALLIPKIANAKTQAKTAAVQLATLVGDRNAREVNVHGELPVVDRKSVVALVGSLPSHLYENEKAEEQVTQLDSQRTLTLSKELPALSGLAAWGRSAYVKTDLLNDNATNWAVSLQLSIPLFSGLSSFYERRAFASQQNQLEFNALNVSDQTALNQVQTLEQLDLSEDTVRSSERAFELAVKSLAEAKKQFRLGTSNLLQYLTSQQSLLEAQTTFDQAKHDYVINQAKYVAAMGYPPYRFVEKLENGI